MKPTEHSRLISEAAKLELAPVGCSQKGRSRTWLDDHGWWVGVVEFQPHSGARGSYLNVGACWLWFEKDYFSFDDGHRVKPFQEFTNAQQFAEDAKYLAKSAREEVLKLRLKYPTIEACADHLCTHALNAPWGYFHAGVAAGLSGKADIAEYQFSRIAKEEPKAQWTRSLQDRAAQLASMAHDQKLFTSEIASVVDLTRRLLKLPIAQPFVPLSNETSLTESPDAHQP